MQDNNTQIKITGLDDILTTLNNIEQIEDKLNIAREIANIIYNATEQSLQDEISPDGTRYAKLKPSTIKSKQKRGTNRGKKLLEKGQLRGSLQVQESLQSVIVGLNARSLDTGYFYPFTHQFGTNKAGRGKSTTIPARAFFPLNDDNTITTSVYEEIADFLSSGVDELLK